MPTPLARFVPLVGLTVLLATPGRAAESEPQRPDFSGRWKLDAAKSDDARAKLHEAMAGGGMGGGGRRSGGFGGGMGPGRRGDRGGGMNGDHGPGGRGEGDRGEEMRTPFEGLELLSITQSDAALNITYANGRQRTLDLVVKDDASGKTEEKTTAKSKASWQGAKLVVESRSERDRSSSETWEMGPDGKVFTLTTKLAGGRLSQPVVIFRVYRSAPADETSAPSPTAAAGSPPTAP